MGGKPPTPYPSNYTCAYFEYVFGEPTPDIISISFAGVTPCAGPWDPDPNGIHLCPNTPGSPCLWQRRFDDWAVSVEMEDHIEVRMALHPTPLKFAFIGAELTGSTFDNLCWCDGIRIGQLGTATISWGPPPLS